MNISIEKKKENSILSREEIEFKVDFDAAVPSREQSKSALSSAISIPKERIVIISITNRYGSKSAVGKARVYTTAALAAKDKNHFLVRDKMAEKKSKRVKKVAAAKAKKE